MQNKRIIKTGVSTAKTFGTTVSLYVPKGGKWSNIVMTVLSAFTFLGFNKIFDKCWQTEYEKYQRENAILEKV